MVLQARRRHQGGGEYSLLADKLTIVLGERDGIAGPAIAACVKAAKGEVAFASTECFV
jgi:glycine/sarcosine/betaine reductase complex component A